MKILPSDSLSKIPWDSNQGFTDIFVSGSFLRIHGDLFILELFMEIVLSGSFLRIHVNPTILDILKDTMEILLSGSYLIIHSDLLSGSFLRIHVNSSILDILEDSRRSFYPDPIKRFTEIFLSWFIFRILPSWSNSRIIFSN